MPLELRRASANSVCAQDFETTIQPYVSAQHLRGVLNFSALWNEVTYIYDTAVGDNPNLLNSQWALPSSPDHALYTTFREFIKEGIVRCLVRDKVCVDGLTIKNDPTISELYDGWRRRDGENNYANFLTQEFGNKRTFYNQHIDRLLFEDNPGAILRYDPDIAKPRFRTIINEELSNKRILWELVCKLPTELRYEYERTCAEKQLMTTVDLWKLVKENAELSPPAKDLLLMQGYVNQQAIADSIAVGVVGSDCGPWRPAPSDQQSAATTPADVLDQADFTLTAPPIELLALLSPSDIKELRVLAKTFFNLSVPEGANVPRHTVYALTDYWAKVCEFLDRKYPQHTRVKAKVLGYFDGPVINHFNRRHAGVKGAVSVIVKTGVKILAAIYAPVGTGVVVDPATEGLKWVRYRLLYTPSPALIELRGMRSALWGPKDVWTVP